MRNSWILYKKELLETLRSYKLLWIPIVFLILGVMQPISAYYLPEILKQAGEVPPGLLDSYTVPAAGQVMAEALGQYGTIGMLVLALGTMNVLAGERASGTAELLLVRPLSAAAIALAKWAAQLTLLAAALLAGAAGAAYYTEALIGGLDYGAVGSAVLLYGLWLLCGLSLTLLFSAWLRGPAAACLALLSVAALAVAHSVLPHALSWTPASLSGLSAQALTEGGGEIAGPVISAAILIVLCIGGAALLVRRQHSPE